MLPADDGATSLREAITFLNANGGGIVTFDETFFSLGLFDVIRLDFRGPIEVTENISIQGPTAIDIVISGDRGGNDARFGDSLISDVKNSSDSQLFDNSRIFDVTTPGVTFSLDRVTLSGAVSRDGDVLGSAIAGEEADIILTNSVVQGNYGRTGGAVTGRNVTVENTAFEGNVSTTVAGGLTAYGDAVVSGSTFAHNEGTLAGGLFDQRRARHSRFNRGLEHFRCGWPRHQRLRLPDSHQHHCHRQRTHRHKP